MSSTAPSSTLTNDDTMRSSDLARWLHGFDPLAILSSFDFQLISWFGLAAVILVYLFGLFTRSSGPYGRSLVSTAADFWENRAKYGLGDIERGSRSLQPLTGVLDHLAKAVKKWESPAGNKVNN